MLPFGHHAAPCPQPAGSGRDRGTAERPGGRRQAAPGSAADRAARGTPVVGATERRRSPAARRRRSGPSARAAVPDSVRARSPSCPDARGRTADAEPDPPRLGDPRRALPVAAFADPGRLGRDRPGAAAHAARARGLPRPRRLPRRPRRHAREGRRPRADRLQQDRLLRRRRRDRRRHLRVHARVRGLPAQAAARQACAAGGRPLRPGQPRPPDPGPAGGRGRPRRRQPDGHARAPGRGRLLRPLPRERQGGRDHRAGLAGARHPRRPGRPGGLGPPLEQLLGEPRGPEPAPGGGRARPGGAGRGRRAPRGRGPARDAERRPDPAHRRRRPQGPPLDQAAAGHQGPRGPRRAGGGPRSPSRSASGARS